MLGAACFTSYDSTAFFHDFLIIIFLHPSVLVVNVDSVNHTFYYNESLTPVITSMTPGLVRSPDSMVFAGAGLGNIGTEVIIDEDLGYTCDVTFSNDTRVECDVGYLLTAYYNIKVYSDSK